MPKVLTLNKLTELDSPRKLAARRTIADKVNSLVQEVTRRDLSYFLIPEEKPYSVKFMIPKIIVAGTENRGAATGMWYRYEFRDFYTIVKFARPQRVQSFSSPGLMVSGKYRNYVTDDEEEYTPDIRFLHPHFSGSNSMCLAWGWDDEFKKLLEVENYSGLIDAVIASLSQYNSGNPYRHLPHENPPNSYEDAYACPWCGENISENEDVSCVECHREMCVNCAYHCESCGDYLCEDHGVDDEGALLCNSCYEEQLTRCNDCGDMVRDDDRIVCICWNDVCSNCSRTCDHCHVELCENCQNEYNRGILCHRCLRIAESEEEN